MKFGKLRGIVAMLLMLALLTGCAGLGMTEVTHYSDMKYTRPDLDEMERLLEDAKAAAEGEKLEPILDCIYAFNDFYDDFYTCYSLADIRYSGNLKDLYWSEEYDFCAAASPAVDAALEELYYALAVSPCREELEGDDYFGQGFFDSYEGENNWDEGFITLMEQEAELENRYYELSMDALEYEYASQEYYDRCVVEMVSLMAELVGLRQEIAAYWGYEDYVGFANDFYYYRDYTPEQTEGYLQDIRKELVPLYREICDSPNWSMGHVYCDEEQTFAYVQQMARAMGGTVGRAFNVMKRQGLYDIAYGENKYNSSFEVYLTSYWEPFIFMSPTLSVYDRLTFAHEFGHFCNDYVSYGSYAGTDVSEVFSQAMEYLSLCYVEDTEELTWLKLADCLSLTVEQAAFADFEMRMYGLTGEELNGENLRKLYDQVAREYGFDAVSYYDWEFVTINHIYTNPMYVISYVVSNDAALQLYQMELKEKGTGLACFEQNLATEDQYFLEFLEGAGLESPFCPGRMADVRRTLEEALK